MNIEELQKRIDENANNIQNNLEKIESNLDKINENTEQIQKNTLALEILSDYKKDKKVLIGILVAMLVLWSITLIIFHIL